MRTEKSRLKYHIRDEFKGLLRYEAFWWGILKTPSVKIYSIKLTQNQSAQQLAVLKIALGVRGETHSCV